MSGDTILLVLGVFTAVFGGQWVLRIVRDWLRPSFLSSGDLDDVKRRLDEAEQKTSKLSENFEGMTTLITNNRESIDDLRRNADAIRAGMEVQWDRVVREIVDPMQDITRRMEDLGAKLGDIAERQGRHDERIAGVLERLNRLEKSK